MSDNWKKILFLNTSWPMRVWMWSAVLCVIFYLVKFTILPEAIPSLTDMIFMAYGLGSLAIYTLIYGFDWS